MARTRQHLAVPLAGADAIAPERRLGAERGGRAPLLVALHVVDAGVEAGLRQRQARLGKGGGHLQRAGVVQFRPREQQIDSALQAAEVHGAHAVGMGALHCQAGAGHEGHQHQRGAKEEAGPDRIAGGHPSLKW
jgi:hypothetical protein